jgi:MFS family permease
MFWIGAVPAFLCLFIMFLVKEPEKWVRAKEIAKADPKLGMGSYSSLFGHSLWRRHALLGMILCVAGVVGLWGVGFFSPELVSSALERSLKAEGLEGPALSAAKGRWTAYNLIAQNIGAFVGMLAFARLSQSIGRRKAFAIGFLLALACTIFFFRNFNDRSDLWMSSLMGFAQLAPFAGFAIYLPELFPTRLRSTGTFHRRQRPLHDGRAAGIARQNRHQQVATCGRCGLAIASQARRFSQCSLLDQPDLSGRLAGSASAPRDKGPATS